MDKLLDNVPASPARPNALDQARKATREALQMLSNTNRSRQRKRRSKLAAPSEVIEDKRADISKARAKLQKLTKENDERRSLVAAGASRSSYSGEVEGDAEPSMDANAFANVAAVALDHAAITAELGRLCKASGSPNTISDLLLSGQVALASPECLDFLNQYGICPDSICKVLFKAAISGSPTVSASACTAYSHLVHWQSRLSHRIANEARLCVMEWIPGDSDIEKVLSELGYEDAAPGVGKNDARKSIGANPGKHRRAHHMAALCQWISLSRCFHSQGTTGAQVPFGASPGVAAALCCALTEPGFNSLVDRMKAALRDYVAILPEAVWGSALAPVVAILLRHADTVHVAGGLCEGLKLPASPRCMTIRQAVAIEALKRFLPLDMAENDIEDLSLLRVADALRGLGTAKDVLAKLTLRGAPGPDGWRTLAVLRLAVAVAQPELDSAVDAATKGFEPGDLLATTIEPLLLGIGGSLKDRQSVAVFRSRLLCSALCSHFSDTRLAAKAEARRRGQGTVVPVQ